MAQMKEEEKQSFIAELFEEMNYNFCRFMTKLGTYVVFLFVTLGRGIKKFFLKIFGRIINKIGEKSSMRTYMMKRREEFIDEKEKLYDFFFWLREDTESTYVNDGLISALRVGFVHFAKG